ncbi:hypoxanthine phosphoribosyltransferase [bacterium]|nr:hypoxanthine phosphoribosyltransferase [bacterium]
MENYKIHKLIDQMAIKTRIAEVAKQIENDYSDTNPIIAVVLKGGFIFAADLVRNINTPFTIDFIGASSYIGTKSSGDIKITKDLNTPVGGRNLILVEDIVDTGLTLYNLCKTLQQREPLSIKIAALLLKNIDRPFDLPVDYYAFEIPDKFVVGFGLDYNEKHRGLPYVGYIEPFE